MLPARENEVEERPASASDANVDGTRVYRCDVQGIEDGRRGSQACRVRRRARGGRGGLVMGFEVGLRGDGEGEGRTGCEGEDENDAGVEDVCHLGGGGSDGEVVRL